MSEERLDYPKLVERAMRGVVRDALIEVAAEGLPPGHHFFLTFDTQAEGVALSDTLYAQYPDEMTIVLQHQFWDLVVDDAQFAVTLSFKGRPERLTVPFAALKGFVDPHVKFGLQFQNDEVEEDEDELDEEVADAPEGGEPPASGQVVALDAFRKKT